MSVQNGYLVSLDNKEIYNSNLASEAKEKVKEKLKNISGVMGVGLTRVGKSYAVKVNLADNSKMEDLIKQLASFPLVLEVVGKIAA